MNHGLIPGVASLTGRQAVFFTVFNPMDNQDVLGETLCDLSKSTNRAIQKHLETPSGHSILVQFEARSTRTANFNKQGRTKVFLYDTLLAEFIDQAMCMKTKVQLYQRESVILRPRVVLTAYSKSGSQDLPVQEARSSWESQ